MNQRIKRLIPSVIPANIIPRLYFTPSLLPLSTTTTTTDLDTNCQDYYKDEKILSNNNIKIKGILYFSILIFFWLMQVAPYEIVRIKNISLHPTAAAAAVENSKNKNNKKLSSIVPTTGITITRSRTTKTKIIMSRQQQQQQEKEEEEEEKYKSQDNIDTNSSSNHNSKKNKILVIGTRIHLGKSMQPSSKATKAKTTRVGEDEEQQQKNQQQHDDEELNQRIYQFLQFCYQSCPTAHTIVFAVDVTPNVVVHTTFDPATTSTSTDVDHEDDDDDDHNNTYNLYKSVQIACKKAVAQLQLEQSSRSSVNATWNELEMNQNNENNNTSSSTDSSFSSHTKIHILPVTPWGQFVPALNAIVSYSASIHADQLLLVSMEMRISFHVIQQMQYHYEHDTTIATTTVGRNDSHDDTLTTNTNTTYTTNTTTGTTSSAVETLVVGVRLPGHDYKHNSPTVNNNGTINSHSDDNHNSSSSSITTDHNSSNECCTITELNGITSPWNTLALWNVSKLALTGFQLISDGYLQTQDGSSSESSESSSSSSLSYAGIEEVITITILQQLLGTNLAQAKLIQIQNIPSSTSTSGTNSNSSSNNSDNNDTTTTTATTSDSSSSLAVLWDTSTFENDTERKKWHEEKMKSKYERSMKQLSFFPNLLHNNNKNNKAIVYHC